MKLADVNTLDRAAFVAICGPLFEHSPWVAERAFDRSIAAGERSAGPGTQGARFATIDALHAALCDAMYSATVEEQVKLIASHPDLVGRLAKQGRLTNESTAEQAAAGLNHLSPEEATAFDRYNAEYHGKFNFPFVICARENKKEAILKAFPVRLNHSRDAEIKTALAEIAKIAKLRLLDAVSEG